MAKLIEEVSDHKLIKLVVGADVRHRKDQPVWEAYDQVKGRVPIAKFPQSNINRMMSDQSVQDHLVDGRINLMERPIIQQIPEDLATQFAPRGIPTRPVVRYQKSKQLPKQSEELQIKTKLDNQKMLEDLKRHYDAKDMKMFYATAEKVLRIKHGNPVVRAVINDNGEVTNDKAEVDKQIAEYFRNVYKKPDTAMEVDQ